MLPRNLTVCENRPPIIKSMYMFKEMYLLVFLYIWVYYMLICLCTCAGVEACICEPVNMEINVKYFS